VRPSRNRRGAAVSGLSVALSDLTPGRDERAPFRHRRVSLRRQACGAKRPDSSRPRSGLGLVVPALVTFGPKNDLEFHGDLLEWLLYLPELDELLPRPVSGRHLVRALRDLCRVTFVAGTNPYEVRLAWQMGLDVMGALIFQAFYNMGHGKTSPRMCHPTTTWPPGGCCGPTAWRTCAVDAVPGRRDCGTQDLRGAKGVPMSE
jgi:hypothetical protein